jgi:hypothetical protein
MQRNQFLPSSQTNVDAVAPTDINIIYWMFAFWFSKSRKQTKLNRLPYFIEYNVHASIVRTWMSQWFLAFFSFFKNNFTRINHCKFIYHKSHLKPFLSYLPCIAHKEYFSIIFTVTKCTLYSIKYGTML